MKDKHIIVLMGGPSAVHEVSRRTAASHRRGFELARGITFPH